MTKSSSSTQGKTATVRTKPKTSGGRNKLLDRLGFRLRSGNLRLNATFWPRNLKARSSKSGKCRCSTGVDMELEMLFEGADFWWMEITRVLETEEGNEATKRISSEKKTRPPSVRIHNSCPHQIYIFVVVFSTVLVTVHKCLKLQIMFRMMLRMMFQQVWYFKLECSRVASTPFSGRRWLQRGWFFLWRFVMWFIYRNKHLSCFKLSCCRWKNIVKRVIVFDHYFFFMIMNQRVVILIFCFKFLNFLFPLKAINNLRLLLSLFQH